MAPKDRAPHPGDDVLINFVEDEATASSSATRAHVTSCAQCIQRVAELRATRRLLQDAASDAVEPKHDLAALALDRLRMRRSAIGNMNEVISAMRALLRGLVDLFGGGPPTDTSGSVIPANKGARRG